MTLSPHEIRRLDSWTGVIAQSLRPEAPVARTADGLRIGRKGSLSITADATWYDHETGKGGHDALSLIRHLRGCSSEAAIFWARGWLEQHLGDGDPHVEVDAEAVAEASARRTAWALQVLDDATDPLATPAAAYLRSRGLVPPFPPGVRWLEGARLGEGAIVGVLTTALGDPVGIQLGYLDPQGRKSVMQPERQLFLLDRQAAGQGAFRVGVTEPAAGGMTITEFVITEGLENALALAQAAVGKTVLGVPGVGRLEDLDLPAGAVVVVVRDGKDTADSPAAKAFIKAVDRWLLAKVIVRITDTPSGEDANSVLLAHGPEELRRLVTEAASGQLSFDGELTRLFELDPVEYERQRVEAAKKHGVRRSFLDDARKAARAEAETAEEAAKDDPPYHEPVTDLAAVLDAALVEVQRYVVAPEQDLATAVVWSVHAHLVHHPTVQLLVSPKLATQSPDKQCGKTTLLEVIGALVPRPETGSSITAAAVFRLIEARSPTLLIDEADRVLRSSNEELIAVLNSGHRRSGAYVWRVEEVAKKRMVVKFKTWGAVAFAGIRELPETLQDRSIVIRLVRAKPGEVKAHLKNGTSPTLQLIKAKLARWALDLRQFPEPTLPPGLHNRLGDNWAPLFAIAEIAGGRWPALMKRAALSAKSADQGEGQLVALLEGIRRALGEKDRISTRELIDSLLADDEYDWAAANKGRPINEAWLRERLRNVITPDAKGKPGSERWGQRTKEVRGYSRRRFEDAWARYLYPLLDSQNHPADPATDDNTLKDKDKPSPDEGASTRRRDGEHLATDEHSATGNGEGASSDDDTSPDAEGPVGGCDEMHTTTDNQTKSKCSTPSPDTPDGGTGEKIKSDGSDLMDEMPDFLRRPPPGEDTSPPKWEPL